MLGVIRKTNELKLTLLRYDKYLAGAFWEAGYGVVGMWRLPLCSKEEIIYVTLFLNTQETKLGEKETSHLGKDGCSDSFLFWLLEECSSHVGSRLVGSPCFLAQL